MLSGSHKLITMTPARPVHHGGGAHYSVGITATRGRQFTETSKSFTTLPELITFRSHECRTPDERLESSRLPARRRLSLGGNPSFLARLRRRSRPRCSTA